MLCVECCERMQTYISKLCFGLNLMIIIQVIVLDMSMDTNQARTMTSRLMQGLLKNPCGNAVHAQDLDKPENKQGSMYECTNKSGKH